MEGMRTGWKACEQASLTKALLRHAVEEPVGQFLDPSRTRIFFHIGSRLHSHVRQIVATANSLLKCLSERVHLAGRNHPARASGPDTLAGTGLVCDNHR